MKGVFSDILLELGPALIDDSPTRSGPWTLAQVSTNGRLRTSQPATAVSFIETVTGRHWTVWVVGEIEQYGSLSASTQSCLREFERDLSGGKVRPDTLSGRFLIIGWCHADDKWAIWTDRVGSIHAYKVARSGRTVVGTFSASVYQYSARRLDWPALGGFFSLGFFTGGSTYYDDCCLLRPATCYEFSAAGGLLRETVYWSWTHRPDRGRSEPDTIAEFGETFGSAVSRSLSSGRVVLPLSGGLDSRTVAACMPREMRVPCYGYGYHKDSTEIRIARQVADVVGQPFHAHVIGPYLFDRLPEVLDAVEGFQDLTQSRQADISNWLLANADYVAGAHWGDVLCDSMGMGEDTPVETAFDQLFGKLEKRGSAWLLDHICLPQMNGFVAEKVVRARIRNEFDRFTGISDADFRAKAVKTSQWAFRWTLPSIRMYQVGAVPRLPFLSSSVIEFFCTVPTEMLKGRRLQIEYLKNFAPALAQVRWQAYDSDLFHYHHFHTWQLPRRVWKKLERLLDSRPRISRNWEVQFRSPGMMERLRSSILDSNSAARHYAPIRELRALLDEFERRPTGANGYTISMLYTFCAWVSRFHQ